MRLRVLLAAAVVLAPSALLAEGGAVLPALTEEQAEKKVREILATFDGQERYSSREPRVTEIVDLGRIAVPPLMRYLREFSGTLRRGFDLYAARDALETLAEEKDFAELAEMVADRVFEAARPLSKLRNPKVVQALLVPISKGFVEWGYVEDLRKFSSRKEVRAAFVAYMEKFARTTEGFSAAPVARAIGECKVAEGIPILNEILAEGKVDAYTRQEIAKALVALGEKSGIEALIEFFSIKPDDTVRGHGRHEAGETLNRIAGEVWYQGSFDLEKFEVRGNFEEAAAKFRAWWLKVEPTIRWDPKQFKWVW